MNSDLIMDKVKNVYHFLHELRDLEAKYGMKLTEMKKSPTLDAKFELHTNIDGYEISATCEDVRPLYDVTLEEI